MGLLGLSDIHPQWFGFRAYWAATASCPRSDSGSNSALLDFVWPGLQRSSDTVAPDLDLSGNIPGYALYGESCFTAKIHCHRAATSSLSLGGRGCEVWCRWPPPLRCLRPWPMGLLFVQRNMIILLAFGVILVTLVLQGLTLPPLIRILGIAGTSGIRAEEKEARRAILQTALDHLEESKREADSESAEVYEDLEQHYRHRLAALADEADGQDDIGGRFYKRFNDLSHELLSIERARAVQLRNQRRISDELLREIEHELDLGEARLTAKSE